MMDLFAKKVIGYVRYNFAILFFKSNKEHF